MKTKNEQDVKPFIKLKTLSKLKRTGPNAIYRISDHMKTKDELNIKQFTPKSTK